MRAVLRLLSRLLDATDASAQVASGGLSVAVVILAVNQMFR